MNPVDAIIYNTLAQHRGINLPGIGALGIQRLPAMVGPDHKITPSRTLVVFYPDEQAGFTGITDLIVQANPSDAVAAAGIYAQWKSGLNSDDSFLIPSVGKLENGKFTTAPELYAALNPMGREPVKMSRPVSTGQIILWVVMAALVGGGLSVGLITWLDSRPDALTKPLVVHETETGPNIPVPDDAESSSIELPISEIGPVQTEEPSSIAREAPDSGISADLQPNAGIASGQTRYFVVIGMYSSEANADKFIRASKTQNNRLDYRTLLLRNGKFMVYTGSGNTEAEAATLRREILSDFPEAWILKYSK